MPGQPLEIASKSQHTSDPALQPFLGPSFDPTAYLNSILPSLHVHSSAVPIIPRGSSNLTDLSSRTQSQLTQLSALSTRLTETLAQLTDDILRSGARLAYDVELLRGEAVALSELLTEGLMGEIQKFVPDGVVISEPEVDNGTRTRSRTGSLAKMERLTLEEQKEADKSSDKNPTREVTEPEALTRLRTLHHIRSRLQSVISIFDLALSWPLPPSATSTSASNFISVSAPTSTEKSLPSGSMQESLEAKGQAAQQNIRNSVVELLASDRGAEGVLKAEERIDQLRELVGIWKGTGEERYRTRFVDGLAKMVADKRKEEEGKGNLAKKDVEIEGEVTGKDDRDRGKGLLGGLRRLRDEIYLD